MNRSIVNTDEIKKFMKSRDLSEYGLAKLIGVSYSYVFRVLRGQRNAGKAFILGMTGVGMPVEKIFSVPLPKCNEAVNGAKKGGQSQ